MNSPISNQKSITVLVTGVGAIIGQGIIKCLRQCHELIRIVGLDQNPHSRGKYLCDTFYAKPACTEVDPDYLEFWQTTLITETIDLVLPGLEIDLFFLNTNKQVLSATGSILGINTQQLIDLAQDKWALGLELPNIGLSAIPSTLSQDWLECKAALGSPPFLLKPRKGNGSRGIVRLDDENDLRYWRKKAAGNFMIQKIVGDDDEEYTVGAFGFGNGESLSSIIFRRKLSAAGNTQYAEVIEDQAIEDATRKLSLHFKPIGPTNYQFRKHNGYPYLLEINPRLSSSTSLRAGFGYNESQMAVDFYINNVEPSKPIISSGFAWRYSEDFFIK